MRDDVHVWEQTLSLSELPYLADHRVQDQVVFPASGLLKRPWRHRKRCSDLVHIIYKTSALRRRCSFSRRQNGGAGKRDRPEPGICDL